MHIIGSVLVVVLLIACSAPTSESPDASRRDAPASDAPPADAPGADGGDGGAATPPARCPTVPTDARISAELPRARVDLTMRAATGTVHHVADGGDLQAALDSAVGGDVIELAHGASFTGPFTLRDHAGDGWVIIRSDGTLPAVGTRVGPSDAAAMARLLAPAGLSAIETADGAHHYRFVGVELTTATDAYTTALVALGSYVTTLAALPHHLIIDRCYLHGAATAGTRRGVALNSAETAIIDSYFTDFREMGADSQAILGWTGPGPYGIYGNFLAAAGENLMFGGAASRGPEWNPSDIEICGNHFDKPLTWYEFGPAYAGLDWQNKNLFEIKNARRVLFAGNVLEHNWGDAQVGFAIVLTPRGDMDPSLGEAMQDVTIAYNTLRNVGAAVQLLSRDDSSPGTLETRRIWFTHNVIDVDGPAWHGGGRGFAMVWGGATGDRVGVRHNTVRVVGNTVMAFDAGSPIFTGLVVEDNLFEHAEYGVFGSGQSEGTVTLEFYVPGYVFRGNAIFGGGSAGIYPAGNFFPATVADVGFVDAAGSDLRLAPTSPYRTMATDGGAIGADVEAVMRITAGVAR